jgi:hypothetical protein
MERLVSSYTMTTLWMLLSQFSWFPLQRPHLYMILSQWQNQDGLGMPIVTIHSMPMWQHDQGCNISLTTGHDLKPILTKPWDTLIYAYSHHIMKGPMNNIPSICLSNPGLYPYIIKLDNQYYDIDGSLLSQLCYSNGPLKVYLPRTLHPVHRYIPTYVRTHTHLILPCSGLQQQTPISLPCKPYWVLCV